MTAFATLAPVYSMTAATRGQGSVVAANAESRALEQFLAGVERKAFKIAQMALRNEDDALDAVQDAMLSLVKSYRGRAAEEWRPLFYRILDNRVRDMQRRRTVRGRIMSWLPHNDDDEDAQDPLENVVSPEPAPPQRLEIDEAIGALERAIGELPRRQQQAFLLRNFEALDVAQTATAMGCSEGSVKTHYFRALQALRTQLGDHV